MFFKIFLYELKYWLKSPATYLYFAVFFAMAFLTLAGTAGFFDPPAPPSEGVRLLNSPFELNYMLQYFNKFFLFLLPAIIGATVYKDYKYKVHSILYTFPIEKRDYLLGKFFGAFAIVLLIISSVGLAFFIAEQLPNLDAGKIGEFNSIGYLQVYGLYTIPNMLFYGAIVFAIVIWYRNIYAGFTVILALFFLQIITENAFGGNGFLIALFDPFAQNTTSYVTQYWTLDDQNTKVIPVIGAVLYNRLFWLSITASIFAYTYHKFSFSEHAMAALKKKMEGKRETKSNFNQIIKVAIPSVTYDFSIAQQLKNSWRLSMINFRYIVQGKMFIFIVLLGVLAIIFALAKVTNNGGINLLPVTHIVLTIPAFFFSSIIILLTFIYSGMLLHRDRTSGINQLIDATPIPNWTLLLSKLLALMKMQAVLLLVLMFAGMILQVYNGYYHFEIGLYLFHLFGVLYIGFIIWAFASLIVHTFIPNVYLGIFVLVLGWLGLGSLPDVGLDSKLLLFNSPERLSYSDLNGYGSFFNSYFLIEAYWLVFGLLLLVGAYVFWFRGLPHSFKERLDAARLRWTNPVKMLTGVLLLTFVLLGFKIHKEESKKLLLDNKVEKRAFKAFTEKYKGYQNMVPPKITSFDLELDLYTEENRFEAKGQYTLINKSQKTIDTLLVKKGFDEETTIVFDRETDLISEDAYVQFSVLKLKEGLAAGDSLKVEFTVENKPNSAFERNSNILHNGTFLKSDVFPRFGYALNSGDRHPSDSNAVLYNQQSIDADLINFKARVSTSLDQIVLAPGYLQKEWIANDRRYFQYQINHPIEYFFGFNSGKFEVKKEHWKGVELEVYYHKGHEQNLNKMMDGLKAALDYNTHYFGSYQHKHARIIEFPHTEGTYATISANSIPTSEIRFIANTATEEGKVDLSFYTIAHEMTHEWWGSQLIPADALGALMLSESITEYISLKMYGRYYGKEQEQKFLKLQRQRYLKGRTRERGEEPPLFLAKSGQQYLAYGKGTIAMNAMSHYLGEDRLNAVLKDFLEAFRFQSPPYPTSLDLMKRLKAATPDSLQYVIEDLFETITFYNNKIESATSHQTADGSYDLNLSFSIQKNRDQDDQPLPLNDYIEIGIYDKADQLLHLKRHKATAANNQINIQLKQPAAKIILDPNILLIDKNQEDNVYLVKEE